MKPNARKRPLMSKSTAIMLALLVAAGIAIFALAFISRQQTTGIGELNNMLLSWFSTHRTPMLDTIMKVTTSTASPSFFVLIASVGSFYWAYKKREIWRPFLMTIAIIVSASASSIIKLIIQNNRPEIFDMVPPIETSFSFPSGHTLSTFVFLLATGYLFYSRYLGKDKFFWLATWLSATTLGTFIIAITRLYLGYHWFTDVFASIGVGLIIFAAVIFVDKIFIRYYKKITVLI